ncbi:hypothetical protein OPT61_g9921 [Boeremia exigua]|uniref:Uncharacterized protein n=1 Tax=Boeremia exigua TaxID=749465 RepID=A0ACC2HSB7_9PLEO|nr:hypothetical protein OPT61_g9921 [Boeremia exigua]
MQLRGRNGHEEEELLGGGVLVAVVDLLPHVEVVVGARVEVKGDAADVVEHEVGAGHVGQVDQGPGRLLRHPRDDVEEDLADEDEHKVDCPGACGLMSAVSEGSGLQGADGSAGPAPRVLGTHPLR